MPVTYPGVQYSGIWTMQQVNAAIAANTWPPAYNDANLYTWGHNNYGQLGIGNTSNRSSPSQVGALANWLVVAGCYGFTNAIKNNGTLWAWGRNNFGQLGLGNTTSYSSPVQVGALTSWSTVSAGGRYHTVAIKTDGTLWSWGQGTGGKLGLGNTTNYSSPKQVGALTNWSKVNCGLDHCLAIKTDGTLWSWGVNSQGQLGLGAGAGYKSSPNQVGALTTWSNLAPLGTASIVSKTDGTLWAWGNNTSGQLGLGNTTTYSSPKQVGALTTWLNASAGCYAQHTMYTKTDGTLWAWGAGTLGALGLGNTTSYSSPKQVGALTSWLTVAGGAYYSTAVKTDGTVWSWGYNFYGQLGLSNTTYYSSPKQIGASYTWVKISCGNGSVVATSS